MDRTTIFKELSHGKNSAVAGQVFLGENAYLHYFFIGTRVLIPKNKNPAVLRRGLTTGTE
jgi:hypothetical protein